RSPQPHTHLRGVIEQRRCRSSIRAERRPTSRDPVVEASSQGRFGDHLAEQKVCLCNFCTLGEKCLRSLADLPISPIRCAKSAQSALGGPYTNSRRLAERLRVRRHSMMRKLFSRVRSKRESPPRSVSPA